MDSPGPEMDGTFGVLVDRCEQILCSDELGRGIRETSAVCLGRIAKFSVGVVHPHMQKIVPPWLLVLRSAVDNDDKHDAFEGLCELVLAYPQVHPAFSPLFLNYNLVTHSAYLFTFSGHVRLLAVPAGCVLVVETQHRSAITQRHHGAHHRGLSKDHSQV